MTYNLKAQLLKTSAVAMLILGMGLRLSFGGPCSDEIAQIEAMMGQPSASSVTNSDGNQSLANQQAPPHARTELRSDPRYVAAMERARALDAENSPACMKLTREVKSLVGR